MDGGGGGCARCDATLAALQKCHPSPPRPPRLQPEQLHLPAAATTNRQEAEPRGRVKGGSLDKGERGYI